MGKVVSCEECRKAYRNPESLEDLRDNDGICLVCNSPIEVEDWDRVLASYENEDDDEADEVDEDDFSDDAEEEPDDDLDDDLDDDFGEEFDEDGEPLANGMDDDDDFPDDDDDD
jgi:hypothetical protein